MNMIGTLPLKEMDSALLTISLMVEVDKIGLDTAKVRSALAMASFLHRKQTRASRGGLPRTPYIEHPLRNALRLIRWGCVDQDTIIAAILHDTQEDCFEEMVSAYGIPGETHPRQILTRIFGDRVAFIVNAVSNPDFPAGMSRVERNALYCQHVIHIVYIDPGVMLVKLSDFFDNAISLRHSDLNSPKEISMARSLSNKYLPLVPVFLDAISFHGNRLLLADTALVSIDSKLHQAENSLRDFLQA